MGGTAAVAPSAAPSENAPGPRRRAAGTEDVVASKLMVVTVLTSVLFFICLGLLEIIPEIPVDIDQKPFFIPLAFVALLPRGAPTIAAALGAALGEGLRDIFEGYELDDPFGFLGYAVSFSIAGFIVGNKPLSKVRLVIAALVCGFVQSAIEASTFLLFGEHGMDVAILAAAGNTVTHGIIGGAIPLVFFVPHLHGRIERYLGFPPK